MCTKMSGLNIQLWKRAELTRLYRCWTNNEAYFLSPLLSTTKYHIFKVGGKIFTLIVSEIVKRHSTQMKYNAEIYCCYNNAFHLIFKDLNSPLHKELKILFRDHLWLLLWYHYRNDKMDSLCLRRGNYFSFIFHSRI